MNKHLQVQEAPKMVAQLWVEAQIAAAFAQAGG